MPGISINGVTFPSGATIRMKGGVYPPGTTFKIANVTITNPSTGVIVNLSTSGYPRPDMACSQSFNSGRSKLYTDAGYRVIYTDSGLTNIFNGNGFWYYTDDYLGSPAAVLIGQDGSIVSYIPC